MDIIGDIVNAIKTAINTLKTFVLELAGKVKSEIAVILPALKDKFKSILADCIAAIKGMLASLEKYVKSAIKSIKNSNPTGDVKNVLTSTYSKIKTDVDQIGHYVETRIIILKNVTIHSMEDIKNISLDAFDKVMADADKLKQYLLKSCDDIVIDCKTELMSLKKEVTIATTNVVSKVEGSIKEFSSDFKVERLVCAAPGLINPRFVTPVVTIVGCIAILQL